jgi:hypothetical protein
MPRRTSVPRRRDDTGTETLVFQNTPSAQQAPRAQTPPFVGPITEVGNVPVGALSTLIVGANRMLALYQRIHVRRGTILTVSVRPTNFASLFEALDLSPMFYSQFVDAKKYQDEHDDIMASYTIVEQRAVVSEFFLGLADLFQI